MKHLLLILVCLTAIISTYGQYGYGQAIIELTKLNRNCIFTKSRIFTKVEVKGAFPVGDTTWQSDLEKNLKASMASIVIPKRAKKGKYSAVIVYIISKDGSLSDIACRNDPGYGICETATRVVKKFKTWGPGKWYPVDPLRH